MLGQAALRFLLFALQDEGLLVGIVPDKQRVVVIQNIFGSVVGYDPAFVQQHRGVAKQLDGAGIMTDEDERSALGAEILQILQAFLLEIGVAHRQRFVDDQYVGIDVGGDGETEPERHTGRIDAQRMVEEVAKFRELHDALQFLLNVGVGKAQEARVQVNVLAPGELRMEARAQFQQARDAAFDLDAAESRRKRSAENLQKRTLAGAVHADDAQGTPLFHLEVDLPQRPVSPVEGHAARRQPFFEPVKRSVVNSEALGEAFYLNNVVFVHIRSGLAVLS